MRRAECGWCRKEKEEVFDVAFSDRSFVGLMCKADLLRAIGMKVGEPRIAAPPTNGVNDVTVPK
ncbi:hypothetical protein BH10PLA2_BH10PLA2_09440 [soil metagenome]